MSEWGNPAVVVGGHPPVKKIVGVGVTRGSETSQYPQEEKTTVILLVVANERGLLAKPYACDTRQGLRVRCCGAMALCGLPAAPGECLCVSGSGLEWPAVDGESPVRENTQPVSVVDTPSSSGLVESAVNQPGPPGKPEYSV